MKKVILANLTGSGDHRLEQEAYALLDGYLRRAGKRLEGDPDRAEVLDDLERSIGEKLARLSPPAGQAISRAEIAAVLEEVGAVDVGDGHPAAPETLPTHGRRWCRIREGQWFAGVCTGLAARSEIGVDWVRTLFILATVATGGLVAVVYLAMVFAFPVVETREEYVELHRSTHRQVPAE